MLNRLNALKPNIHDVFDSLRPFYILGHVVGLGFHRVVTSSNGRKYYKILKFHIVRYVLHLCALVGIYYYFLDQDQLGLAGFNLVGSVSFYGTVVIKSLALINMLMGGVFVKKITYIINAVGEVDENIEKLGVEIGHWYV